MTALSAPAQLHFSLLAMIHVYTEVAGRYSFDVTASTAARYKAKLDLRAGETGHPPEAGESQSRPEGVRLLA